MAGISNRSVGDSKSGFSSRNAGDVHKPYDLIKDDPGPSLLLNGVNNREGMCSSLCGSTFHGESAM